MYLTASGKAAALGHSATLEGGSVLVQNPLRKRSLAICLVFRALPHTCHGLNLPEYGASGCSSMFCSYQKLSYGLIQILLQFSPFSISHVVMFHDLASGMGAVPILEILPPPIFTSYPLYQYN